MTSRAKDQLQCRHVESLLSVLLSSVGIGKGPFKVFSTYKFVFAGIWMNSLSTRKIRTMFLLWVRLID